MEAIEFKTYNPKFTDLEKNEGIGYFTAYRHRMDWVRAVLKNLASKYAEKGYEVYISGGSFYYISVKNNDRELTLGFTDVPYRWYIESGHSGVISYNYEENPFFDIDLDDTFVKNSKLIDPKKHEWRTFVKEIEQVTVKNW